MLTNFQDSQLQPYYQKILSNIHFVLKREKLLKNIFSSKRNIRRQIDFSISIQKLNNIDLFRMWAPPGLSEF